MSAIVQWTERNATQILIGIFLAGVILTSWLFFQTREDVFYLGDHGLKFMMLKQYASGDFSVYLHATPEWVSEAWDAGLYPIKPPFVVQQDEGRVAVFPVLFQLVSTPFYLLFGFRGLYILPTLALWFIWWRFIVLIKALKFRPLVTILLAICLVFGMPMVLYGAMFWEHTLAALLVLLGLEFVFYIQERELTRLDSALRGAMFGLAVWFRPEAFLITLPIVLFLILRYFRQHSAQVTIFVASYLFVVCAFLAANWILYRFPLGVHGTQVVATSIYEKVYGAYFIFVNLLRRMWRTFPLAALIVVLIPVLLVRVRKPVVFLMATLLLIFVIPLPFLVPSAGGKQWGPRFLFVIFPVILLLAGFQLEEFSNIHSRPLKLLYLALFVGMMGVGVYINSIQGSIHLNYSYADRTRPALLRIKEVQPDAVAIYSEDVAMELGALYHDLNFFLIEEDEDFRLLGSYLRKQQICEFIYVTQTFYDSPPGDILDRNTSRALIRFTEMNRYGIYTFYRVQLADCEISRPSDL